MLNEAHTLHRARKGWILLSAICIAWCGATASLADEASAPVTSPMDQGPVKAPKVVDLGNGKYRIGAIHIDKTRQHFEVAATILRDSPPLEFLAISKGGFKAYESLIEVDANAYEFNLACILMGLDAEKAKAPKYHFDPAPAEGEPVDVFVEWTREGKTTRVDASELLAIGSQTLPPAEWVYTGSLFTADNQFLAHMDGTLIGFVHDPASIIEHRSGFLGSFESVAVNPKLLLKVGTQVKLIVARRNETPEPKQAN